MEGYISQPSVQRPSAWAKLQENCKELEELHPLVIQLADRLNTILCPENPNAPSGISAKPVPTAPIMETLNSQELSISELRRKIRDLIDRIQL